MQFIAIYALIGLCISVAFISVNVRNILRNVDYLLSKDGIDVGPMAIIAVTTMAIVLTWPMFLAEMVRK